MRLFSALVCGSLFGAGLVVSGMTQPAKVIGFLDVTGAWDPSLAFVMAGAIAVYAPVYHRVFRPRLQLDMPSPLPTRIDARLLLGAAIFGIGWGIGGFCPGPAITSLGAGAVPALVVVGAMLAGMLLHRLTLGASCTDSE